VVKKGPENMDAEWYEIPEFTDEHVANCAAVFLFNAESDDDVVRS
jgi:hypothetical protein